jgi:predicted NBD/HSP70 family sugar kinase
LAVVDERSLALLIRVWLEDGEEPCRARVIAVAMQGPGDARAVAVAASPGQVMDAVSQWLEEFSGYETAVD